MYTIYSKLSSFQFTIHLSKSSKLPCPFKNYKDFNYRILFIHMAFVLKSITMYHTLYCKVTLNEEFFPLSCYSGYCLPSLTVTATCFPSINTFQQLVAARKKKSTDNDVQVHVLTLDHLSWSFSCR